MTIRPWHGKSPPHRQRRVRRLSDDDHARMNAFLDEVTPDYERHLLGLERSTWTGPEFDTLAESIAYARRVTP